MSLEDDAPTPSDGRDKVPALGRVARPWLEMSVEGSALVAAFIRGNFIGQGALTFEIVRGAIVILTGLAVVAAIRRKAPHGLTLPATVVAGVAAAAGFIVLNILVSQLIAFGYRLATGG